jgi:hypothetical protein
MVLAQPSAYSTRDPEQPALQNGSCTGICLIYVKPSHRRTSFDSSMDTAAAANASAEGETVKGRGCGSKTCSTGAQAFQTAAEDGI